MQMLVGVLMNQSFGTYTKVLRDEFGWSRTVFSLAFSMARVETGFLGPVEGWMIDRWGPRRIMQIGVVMLGIGMLLFSQIQSPAMFIASFLVMSIGASFASFMPVSVAIVNWFERRRARALSVLSVGMASGGLLVPILIYCIQEFGWRETAFGSGVLLVVVGLPLSFLIRHRPEDHGMHKDGIDPATEERHADGRTMHIPQVSFTAREALRTRSFWFIALGHASVLLIISALQVHMTLHLTENLDYSLVQAGYVSAMIVIMQYVGQGVTAVVGDRWSKRGIVVVCMVMHSTAILLLAYATALWMVVAFAVLHGIAWGARGPLMAAIRADYFGGANFGTIMGTSSLITAAASTIAPTIAGMLADYTGNFRAGFTVLAIMALLGSFFFIAASPPALPHTSDAAAEEPEGRAALD